MFTHNRHSVDLNGTWKFNPDPNMRCRQQKWWKNPGRDDSFFPCWDMEGLWDIQVPGTWKTQFNELKWYDGHVNYVRDFEAPEIPADHEAFLVFDGVVYTAEVYLNGQKVCEHDWGYSPFSCRVTEVLRKQNRLFVLVENFQKPDRVPAVRFDWNNDGGIINGVKLVFVPRTHIENFRTETKIEGDEAVIHVEAWLMGRDRTAEENIEFSIPELGAKTTLHAQVLEKAEAFLRVPLSKITLWTPENPKLYETVLSTRHETIRDEIGYRELRTKGHDVLLNGKPIRLYGVCVHSEFKDTGRTATPKGIEEMLAQVRELGCNFLRCAHYPYAEIWGRAMDKAGILWWQEVPVYWLPNAADPEMTRLATGMMAEAIRRDWNRASLIIWSVSNECAAYNIENFKENNYGYWHAASRMVREMDPSRLISSADSGHRFTMSSSWNPAQGDAFDGKIKNEEWRPGHPDSFYDCLDILSGNVYVMNPGDNPYAHQKFVEMLRAYNKPLMISEFGSMSVKGADCPDHKMGSEKRHETVLREAYQSFHDLPEITGYMPWSLMDVRVPMHWRWYNKGKGVFRYGLLDENWEKKHVFNVVKEEIARLKKRFEK